MGPPPVPSVTDDVDRLDTALRRLTADGRLSPAQADAVRAEFAATPSQVTRSPWSAVLPEVGGYIGAAFVLAAALVVAGPRWDDLGRTGQLLVLGVPSLLMLAAAVAVMMTAPGGWAVHAAPGGGSHPAGARRRLVAVLLLVGIALAVGVVAVLAGQDDGRAAATSAAVGTVLGYGVCRIAVLHVAVLLSLAMTAISWLVWAVPADQGEPYEGPPVTVVAIGVALCLLAVGWALLAQRGVLDERQLGLVAAGVVFFVGAQLLATGSGRAGVTGAGYLLLALLAVAGLLGYVRTRYLGVLAVGVIALAVVIPQAVIDYTDGALGAGGALLLIGLSIVVASVLGLRLRKSTTPPSASGADISGGGG
jgi:hypothetical protein